MPNLLKRRLSKYKSMSPIASDGIGKSKGVSSLGFFVSMLLEGGYGYDDNS